MKPEQFDLKRISRLPNEIIGLIFSHLPLKHVLAFKHAADLSGLVSDRLFSRLAITNFLDPSPDPYANHMDPAGFETFAKDPEHSSFQVSYGCLRMRYTGLFSFTPEAVERLKRIKRLNIRYVFFDKYQFGVDEIPQFDNVNSLSLSCSQINWTRLSLPPRLRSFSVTVAKDPQFVSHDSVYFPESLRRLSIHGLTLTPTLYSKIPSMLEELLVGGQAAFSVSDFNQASLSCLKKFRMSSSWLQPMGVEGIVLPDTLVDLKLDLCRVKVFANVALPKNLRGLCFRCGTLEKFEVALPDGLEVLEIDNTRIKQWSHKMPQSLRVLAIRNSSLSELAFLQKLPAGLQRLDLSGNRLRGNTRSSTQPVFRFPDSLISLNLSKNPKLFQGCDMASFVFPQGLVSLDVTDTGVSDIMAKLPSGCLEMVSLVETKRRRV